MGKPSSKISPTVKPRDEERVIAARQHIEPIRDSLEGLRDKIQGQVFFAPKDSKFTLGGNKASDAYHALRERPFYLNDCNYPSAIIVVESAEDVSEAIKVIKEFDREKYQLCVAGGCHSHLGMVDNAICLDLSKLKNVFVNLYSKQITIAGGCKIIDAHKALKGTGFGFVTGTNSDTGISGLTMAGGAGYLGPQAGYACDTVVQAKVVLPSGEIVTATDDNEYKDLLRALRGGGGNFGIVVEWTFKLYDVSNAFGGTIVHFAPTLKSIKKVFSNYVDILHRDDLPDASSTLCALPCGAPVFISVVSMIGNEVKNTKRYKDIPFFRRITSLGAWFRMSNDIRRKDYIDDIAPMLEPVQQRTYGMVVGAMVYSLDTAMQDALIHFTRVDYPKSKNASPFILIVTLHGEMRRNDGSKSSIRHRKAEAWIVFEANWKPEATEAEIADVKGWAKRAKDRIIKLGGEDGPHEFCDTDGRRINFFTNEQRTFLLNAKKKYDPTNLLALNKNIVMNSE